MDLRKKILNLDEGLNIYSQLLKDEETILIPFAISQYVTVSRICELLPEYLADLEGNVCKESLCIDFDRMASMDYWTKKTVKLRSDMERLGTVPMKKHGFVVTILGFCPETTTDLYRAIEQKVAGMVEMLKEVQRLIQAAPPSLYGNFFLYQKSFVDKHPIEAAHARWRMDVGVQTPDLLKDRQTLVVADFLKLKVLRFTQGPSKREIEKVDLDEVRSHLPYGYELPDDFEKCCARFRRFISWDGDILKIDYGKFGKYLFVYFYQLTTAERQAFIELDLMLDLIHEDMMAFRDLNLPAPLATPEAMILWQKAMAASWVDDHYQPKLSITLSAMLAFEMAIRLELKDKWKTFETFWHRNNMRSNYNSALKQRQSLKFQDRIKQVFK